MLNLYESVRTSTSFNKLEIGEFLFAEYTCPIGAEKVPLWTRSDYLVHVISGRKTWHTTDGVWESEAGTTLFFKKGAAIVEQFFEVDFCLLMFFVPDQLVKETVRELAGSLEGGKPPAASMKSSVRVENDVALNGFFQSMLAYFAGREKPSEPVLRLKLKELLTGILTGSANPGLAGYFRSLAEAEGPSLREIMELNFRFNLSLQEYAELCHRSLSTFKREFRQTFDATPGKWLMQKRLEHAGAMLKGTKLPVTEVVFESGFEDASHFSRAFKQHFGVSPSAYRSG